MIDILISIAIGIAAGIIDVVPMVLQKLDRYAVVSAFVQWVALGIVITHVRIGGLDGWLTGLIVAVLMALPIVIIVAKADKGSIIPILAMSAILGSLVGLAGSLAGI